MCVSHPAMLLVEMLLARLLCELKMLGCLHGNTPGSWSSGVVTADQRSRDEEDDVDETEDAEDVARGKHNVYILDMCYTSNSLPHF